MSTTTLATLRTRVLERANMLIAGGAPSAFVSTAELNAIINAQCAELHDLRVGAYADEMTTSLQFTVASNASTYAVDTSVYELRGVDRQDSGEWYPLSKFAWNERGHTRSQYLNRSKPRYRWTGDTLYFDCDDASGTYRLWYIPAWADLSADSDALTAPNRWDEFVIAGSAAVLLAKEESDPSVQLGIKAQVKARIEGMAPNRDASGPESIERTRTRYHDDYDDCMRPAR